MVILLRNIGKTCPDSYHHDGPSTANTMGRLVIAHHKSYHPYRRDNIERVRRDEEEARQKEMEEEGRMRLADAEARITLLRERAGVSSNGERDGKSRKKGREDDMKELNAQLQGRITEKEEGQGLGKGKHINLFEDLENAQVCLPLTSLFFLEKIIL
jgi:hypothetical protein